MRNNPDTRHHIICVLALRERTPGRQPMNLRDNPSPVPAASYVSPVIAPPACASSCPISRGSSLRVAPEQLDILDPACGSGATATGWGSAIILDIVCWGGTDGSLPDGSSRAGSWPNEADIGRGFVAFDPMIPVPERCGSCDRLEVDDNIPNRDLGFSTSSPTAPLSSRLGCMANGLRLSSRPSDRTVLRRNRTGSRGCRPLCDRAASPTCGCSGSRLEIATRPGHIPLNDGCRILASR